MGKLRSKNLLLYQNLFSTKKCIFALNWSIFNIFIFCNSIWIRENNKVSKIPIYWISVQNFHFHLNKCFLHFLSNHYRDQFMIFVIKKHLKKCQFTMYTPVYFMYRAKIHLDRTSCTVQIDYTRQNRTVRQMNNPLLVKCLWISIPRRIKFFLR